MAVVKPDASTLAKQTEPDSADLARAAIACLEEYQGERILHLDVRERTPLADSMIIASGRSRLHVGALRDRLLRRLKELGAGRLQVEGGQRSDWILIDGGGLWIHLFHPEAREFYNLEKLWSEEAPSERSLEETPPL